MRHVAALAASAILMAGSSAIAASSNAATPNATAKPIHATKAAARKPAPVHTAESVQCSKEADAKGLHGKPREKFRAACKSALRHHKPIPDAVKS